MNSRQLAAEYRLNQWAQVMKERTESGLNVRQFCTQIQVRENTFYYWQDKLRKRANAELSAVLATPSGFVKMLPAKQEAVQTHDIWTGLQIDVEGVKIAVSHDTDLELLSKTCRALKSL